MDRPGLVAGILAALVLAACSGGDSAAEGTATSTGTATGTATATATAPARSPTSDASSPTATSTATAGPTSAATAGPATCTMSEPNTPPATYFGLLDPGDVVRAVNVDCGIDCGISRADGSGKWLVVIDRTNACLPRPGHTIALYLNGERTAHTEIWRAGGTPENLRIGIALTAP